MSITPPQSRIWWKEPIEKSEVIWCGLAFLWAIIMFAMMPLWHFYGNQNMPNEAYRIDPDVFAAKVEDMVKKYKVGDETNGMPIVAPPAGSDVYLLARLWEWYPVLKLEKGKTYRLHLSSMDWQHGFSIQPANLNLQVHPRYDEVVKLTPNTSGTFGIVCNEFCGIGHHNMVGRIYVVDKK